MRLDPLSLSTCVHLSLTTPPLRVDVINIWPLTRRDKEGTRRGSIDKGRRCERGAIVELRCNHTKKLVGYQLYCRSNDIIVN